MKPSPRFEAKSIHAFLEILGSDSATPGGGSAAALTAAIGTALAEMVARLNQKRRPSKEAGRRIDLIRQNRQKFAKLMTRDAEAFGKLKKRLSQKNSKPGLDRAFKVTAAVPYEICERSVKTLELASKEAARTSRWLASDLAEAAILLEASCLSGRLNVEINLKSIKNKRFVRGKIAGLDHLEKKAARLKNKLTRVLTG